MATFAFVHGAGDVGSAWDGVAQELRARGHRAVAPDLPCDDPEAGLSDYADAIVAAVEATRDGGDDDPLVLVAHSLGGFSAPLAAARLEADQLVFASAMVPRPGETASEWWGATGFPEATAHLAGLDEIGHNIHDVPHEQALAALAGGRDQTEQALVEPFPLAALPAVDTRVVLYRDDRFFPAAFMRAVVRERLGVEPGEIDEIDGSHCAHLSRPVELAARLDAAAPR